MDKQKRIEYYQRGINETNACINELEEIKEILYEKILDYEYAISDFKKKNKGINRK